ncbi:MAG: hypothetical protein KF812_07655, partial [Fimbriimonadaceae bacterium]|nr:hypothetical protein [Fimbriimonadaceae bacterium]
VYEQLGLIPDEAVDALIEAMIRFEIGNVHAQIAEFYRRGRDPRTILESMMYRLSDLTRSLYGVQDGADLAPQEEAARHSRAKEWGAETILNLRGAVAVALKGIQDLTIPRLWLEAELGRIAGTLQRQPVSRSAVAAVRTPVEEQPAPKKAEPAPAAAKQEAAPEPPTEANPEPATVEKPAGKKRVPMPIEDVWQEVVAEWSAKSPKAKSWLQGTFVRDADEERWTIVFPRQISLTRLRESKNAQAKIQESVNERVGAKVRLDMIAESPTAGSNTVDVAVSTVESELTGEVLYEETKRILGQE